jgi:hypothetical protein
MSFVIYKDPVMTCDPTNVFEPVVAYLPSIVVILPPKPLVVVATELDKPLVVVATELDKPLVVVATDELKLPIEELNPEVVVATEPDKLPILEEADDVYELNEPV